MFGVWVEARMSAARFTAALKRKYRKGENSLLLAIQIDDDWSTLGDTEEWESLRVL